MSYKAVIFDLDDTLYDYKSIHKLAMENLCAFACGKFRISKSDFDEAFSLAKKQTKQLLGDVAACHNRLLYCQKTLENLKLNPINGALEMYDCYWNFMLDNMRLREGVIELLQKLKIDGLKIAICTDLTAHIQHRKIQKLGLASYIDVLVTSEETGAEKPSEKMYFLTFEKLKKLVPSLTRIECLFVGDSEERDVQGPLQFGMNALLFSSSSMLLHMLYENKVV